MLSGVCCPFLYGRRVGGVDPPHGFRLAWFSPEGEMVMVISLVHAGCRCGLWIPEEAGSHRAVGGLVGLMLGELSVSFSQDSWDRVLYGGTDRRVPAALARGRAVGAVGERGRYCSALRRIDANGETLACAGHAVEEAR